jgi:hypothetical protein
MRQTCHWCHGYVANRCNAIVALAVGPPGLHNAGTFLKFPRALQGLCIYLFSFVDTTQAGIFLVQGVDVDKLDGASGFW